MIERKQTGVYNANSLPKSLTMERVLEECKTVSATVSGSDASFTWVDDDFLLHERLAGWSEVPLWVGEEDSPHLKGFMFINCHKAVGSGLNFRSLHDTIRDTLSWCQTDRLNEGLNEKLKAGIDPDKELRLLRKWHELAQLSPGR